MFQLGQAKILMVSQEMSVSSVTLDDHLHITAYLMRRILSRWDNILLPSEVYKTKSSGNHFKAPF